jgi:hypothetical protein
MVPPPTPALRGRHIRGEPFHRAGGAHGLSGLRFAALLGGLCEPAEHPRNDLYLGALLLVETIKPF